MTRETESLEQHSLHRSQPSKGVLAQDRAAGRNAVWQDASCCSRRRFFLGVLGAVCVPLFNAGSAWAWPGKLTPLVREVTGGVDPTVGRVKLTLPPLAESGNSVACKIQVESPMTPASHVASIHLFSEKNPRPVIARFHLSPRAGRAEINTRIRLAASQQVVAVAVMNDGSSWVGTADVIVTAAACGVESKDG